MPRKFSEERTRKEMIDPRLEHAGWYLCDLSKVKIKTPVDGYDAEHYELSMQVGELGVLREMRNAEARMQKAVSTGSACRLQIKQGAGVEAQHPLVLVRDALLNSNLKKGQ